MDFTRSATISGGAGRLGAQIARLASALAFFVATLVSVVPTAHAAEPLVAHQARIIGDEARTRIVLDFAEEPEFDVHYLDSPARIVVDFPAVNFAFPTSDLKPTGLFSDIRFGTMGENSARIVLTAKKPVQVTVAETKKGDDGQSFRFVLDAEITTKGKFAELVKDQQWRAPAR